MNAGGVRKDLGAVMYAANVLGSRGPRKMQVITCAYKYWLQSDRPADRLSDTLTDRQTDRPTYKYSGGHLNMT